MRVLIVYASWFGHTQLIANAIGSEFARRFAQVVCTPVSKITASEVIGYDMLVIGTHSHTGHASGKVLQFVEQIPVQRMNRMAVGVFGTREHAEGADGVDELTELLSERGIEPAIAPLHIMLEGLAAYIPGTPISAADKAAIVGFVEELWQEAPADVAVA